MAQAGHWGGPALRTRRGWAAGLALFASVLMLLVGLFHAVLAAAAIAQSALYSVDGGYLFGFALSVWGWSHVGLAALVAGTGLALLAGFGWARVAGIVVAGLSALGNFLFIPYQPLWSMLVIAVDVAVIWALTVQEHREAD